VCVVFGVLAALCYAAHCGNDSCFVLLCCAVSRSYLLMVVRLVHDNVSLEAVIYTVI
jgi:hypothetical protein